jgi:ParB family chromosome partitioning protein
VFEALGAGEITLDVAKAYAATPDQERQAFVFEQLSRSYMAQHPDSIRRMMTQATVSASDRRARFVGEEAYAAAGGRIERDLFSDEDGARWLDIALLERLATEKLDALAAETAASSGLAFVRPTLESWAGYDVTRGLQRVQLESPPLVDAESAEVEALEAETEELIGQLEDEETSEEAREAAEARVREIGARIEAITAKPPVIPDHLKPRIGTFLLLDEAGQPRLDTIYYVDPAGGPHEPEEPGTTDAGVDRQDAAVIVAPPPSKEATLSQALADELAIQRRDILAVHVAADPALALDLAIFLMIDREAGYSSGKSGSSLVALPPHDPVFGFKTPDAAATRAREEASESLDRSWTAADTRSGRFDAFRALPDEAWAAWLAHAVARTLEPSLNLPGGRVCAFHDHLGRLLGIDVAKWWRPTGANYSTGCRRPRSLKRWGKSAARSSRPATRRRRRPSSPS